MVGAGLEALPYRAWSLELLRASSASAVLVLSLQQAGAVAVPGVINTRGSVTPPVTPCTSCCVFL